MNNEELKIVFQAYQILKHNPATSYSVLLEMAAKSLDIFFNNMLKDYEDALLHDQDEREQL